MRVTFCAISSRLRGARAAIAPLMRPSGSLVPVCRAIDSTGSQRYTGAMEVKLPADLEDKLARTADRRGISAELLIREAIERAIDYDDWFIREVEKGLAHVNAGQVLTHEAVGKRVEQKLTDHQSRR